MAPPRLDVSDGATLLRMQSDLEVLLENGPRVSGSDAEGAAASYIARHLRANGLAVTTELVPLPSGLTSRNVTTAAGNGVRHVLLGAHIDSVSGSPGADDNASGSRSSCCRRSGRGVRFVGPLMDG